VSSTRRKSGTLHPLDPVVFGQGLVHESIVRVQQLEDWPILVENGVEEGNGLLDHRVTQLGRVLGEEFLVGLGQIGQAADAEPLAGKVLGHRPRLGIGQHPPDLERNHIGVMEPPGVGKVRQLAVGHGRPEEIGEATGQLVVGDANRALDFGPVALEEIEEAR
jgi:hypothetical protein